MRQYISLSLLLFISHSFIGCVVDPSEINKDSSNMSTAGTEEPGGTEVIVVVRLVGAEVVGGDNAGETAGDSAGTMAK